jgi:RNA polymerase sigma-70 factor (ECF subfamily)
VTQATDAVVWNRACRGGDPDAFGELFERHARAIYNYCFRRTGDWATAEDLTSVVFLETWRRRNRLEPYGDSVLPLLYGVATNIIRSQWRTQRRYRDLLGRVPASVPEPDATDEADSRLDDERRMRSTLADLRALPAAQQDVVALCAFAGLTYEEAAAALGVPVGTIRSRLSRARDRLQDAGSFVPAVEGSDL